MAVPYELSADCCSSGEGSVFSTAGPVAEPNVGSCRFPTGITEFLGSAPVDVNSGQEDHSHVLAVVLEPVPGAAVDPLEADDPCGDVVRIVVVAPGNGQLERPALEVAGVFDDRKRLASVVRDTGQCGLRCRTVGQGECREG